MPWGGCWGFEHESYELFYCNEGAAGVLNTDFTDYTDAMRGGATGDLNTNLTNLSNAMRGTWQGFSSTNLANARGTPPNQNNP